MATIRNASYGTENGRRSSEWFDRRDLDGFLHRSWLKSEGFTILLVEQNFRFASTVADRYYVVEHGKVIDGFANAELSANMDKLHTYLGV